MCAWAGADGCGQCVGGWRVRFKAADEEIHFARGRVLLDGRELSYVSEADDGAGWAVVACLDDEGRVKVNRQTQCVVERKVFGKVRFELTDFARYTAKGRRWLAGKRPK